MLHNYLKIFTYTYVNKYIIDYTFINKKLTLISETKIIYDLNNKRKSIEIFFHNIR